MVFVKLLDLGILVHCLLILAKTGGVIKTFDLVVLEACTVNVHSVAVWIIAARLLEIIVGAPLDGFGVA